MNFKDIENKWQKYWEEHAELYKAEDGSKKQKKYVLVEFPYPSGKSLHIGHTFTFTGGDVYARFKRMQGYNVLFPMGWDAFGLPTENYAIKMKKKPQEVTRENTDGYRAEMKRLAFSFDWSREVNTTDPDYYKWTQWIFVQLFKKGLAYKQEMPINWCPSCKVGLANEEVVDGKCERCGAQTSRRTIAQWVLKITDYADRLIEGLERTNFVEKAKKSQISWIGRKEGINIDFKVKGTDEVLTVFTTTPVNWGATFLVVAPEHKFVQDIANGKFSVDQGQINKIKEYVSGAGRKSEMERTELAKKKTGVFSGLYAINHVNGKEIPIWITDFVLASFGTGAVQGCPGHDGRDWDFAKKFGIPIVKVVDGVEGKEIDVEKECFQVHAGDKGKMVNSDFLDGVDFTEAMKKTMDYFEEKGWGKRVVSYHLRDWIFSRQHYWGEPIPMIYCEECAKKAPFSQGERGPDVSRGTGVLNPGWYPVPEEQLPIKLPEVEHYEPTDTGESPLAKMTDWVNTTCPVCGGLARRETDTMPNWAGSDWYYLAYCFADEIRRVGHSERSEESEARSFVKPQDDIFSKNRDRLKYWMPVDVYFGGDEHTTLHLLYSRFIYKVLFDLPAGEAGLGVVPNDEPYYGRVAHGVILGPDGARMSKSKGNVIVPGSVTEKYGVDVVRMYIMFMGPYDATMAWNEKTLMGVKRFLDRFEIFVNKQLANTGDSKQEVKVIINKLIFGVTKDLDEYGYNTVIAKLMEGLNKLSLVIGHLSLEEIKTLIKLIAPLAPYMAEELWHRMGEEGSVHVAKWPVADERYLVDDRVTIVVSINGKVRDQLIIGNEELNDKDKIIVRAKETEKIKKWLDGKEVVREVYVPGKMVNLVVAKRLEKLGG